MDGDKDNHHRSALRGTSRGGFAGVPNALDLELSFSVFFQVALGVPPCFEV